jgi:hypothetical protein
MTKEKIMNPSIEGAKYSVRVTLKRFRSRGAAQRNQGSAMLESLENNE